MRRDTPPRVPVSTFALLLLGFALLGLAPACGDGGDRSESVSGPDPAPEPPEDVFEPTADTRLEGDRRFSRVRIPPGVTVTATGVLSLQSEGELTVDGALRGECATIELLAAASIRVAGTVDGSCSGRPPDAPPGLAIVAGGDLILSGTTMFASGPVEVLAGASNPLGGTAAAGASLQPAQSAFLRVENARIRIAPESAPDGVARAGGEDGLQGSGIRLQSSGDIEFLGVNQIRAQGGGRGGDGNVSAAGAAEASGGNGGHGGGIVVEAGGAVRFMGPNHSFALGSGGSGGDALTESLESDGPGAPEAVALGGRGGRTGAFQLAAAGGVSVTEAFKLELGRGGAGGSASALAAGGRDADEDPAQPGGDAIAIAGGGGSVTPPQLPDLGDTAPVLSGGDGGAGGSATAIGGTGGGGNSTFPAGAAGGSVEATSGDGGDAVDIDLSTGGNAGLILLSGGKGGPGHSSSCDPTSAGGAGGSGGAFTATMGMPGAGNTTGESGSITLADAGNGGPGGQGEPPGEGGAAGESEMPGGVELVLEDSFQPGEAGPPCPSPAMIFGVTQVMVTGGNTSLDSQVGYRNVRELEIVITGNQITIVEPVDDPTFVPLSGTIDPGGNITAEGTGEVAGQGNVLVTATGSLGATGTLALNLTVGANKSLPPNGLPILYLLTARVRT